MFQVVACHQTGTKPLVLVWWQAITWVINDMKQLPEITRICVAGLNELIFVIFWLISDWHRLLVWLWYNVDHCLCVMYIASVIPVQVTLDISGRAPGNIQGNFTGMPCVWVYRWAVSERWYDNILNNTKILTEYMNGIINCQNVFYW